MNGDQKNADNLRCRYSDCCEQHPVATEDETVSCPTCREWLGLPEVEQALATTKGQP